MSRLLKDGPIRRLLKGQNVSSEPTPPDTVLARYLEKLQTKCPVCGCRGFDEFFVSDSDWLRYVPAKYRSADICFNCYRKFRSIGQLLPQGVRDIDSGLEAMKDAKRREWSSRGYPPGLIDKATRLADEWSSSMARTWSPPGRPDVYEAILKTSYPKALDVAQKWIDVMSAQRY